MLVVSVTRPPSNVKSGWGGWGFRSRSKVAPAKETLADFNAKKDSLCPVQPKFAASSLYKIISLAAIEEYFKGQGDGWERFYEKYPKSSGYWGFSRPGYNAAGDEAVLYVSHTCGWLCGTGHLYFLAKQNGKWEVKNRLMLWIS